MGGIKPDAFRRAVGFYRLSAHQEHALSRWVHDEKRGGPRGPDGVGSDLADAEIFAEAARIAQEVPRVSGRRPRGDGNGRG